MPRINIEDSIYKDNRFIKLCIAQGGLDQALGALVRAWSLAQKWYLSPSKTIPYSEWQSQGIPDAIIDVGLAELKDGMVRVKGSEKQFTWLKQRSEAGKRRFAKLQGNSDNGRSAGVQPLSLSPSLSLNTKKKTLSENDENEEKFRRETFLFKIWNQHRGVLGEVSIITDARLSLARRAYKARPDAAYWTNYVKRVAATPFLCGSGPNGWKANFDWAFNQENIARVQEGFYGDPVVVRERQIEY